MVIEKDYFFWYKENRRRINRRNTHEIEIKVKNKLREDEKGTSKRWERKDHKELAENKKCFVRL